MSHVKLVVLISTDGADFAARNEAMGAPGLVADLLADVVAKLRQGSHGGDIRDINGNRYGRWDIAEVKD